MTKQRLPQESIHDWFKRLVAQMPVLLPMNEPFDDSWILGEEFHIESIQDALKDPDQAALAAQVRPLLDVYQKVRRNGRQLVVDSEQGVPDSLAATDSSDVTSDAPDDDVLTDLTRDQFSSLMHWDVPTDHRPLWFRRPSVATAAVAVLATVCLTFALVPQDGDSTPSYADVSALPVSATTVDVCKREATPDVAPAVAVPPSLPATKSEPTAPSADPDPGVEAIESKPVAKPSRTKSVKRATKRKKSLIDLDEMGSLLVQPPDDAAFTLSASRDPEAIEGAKYMLELTDRDTAIELGVGRTLIGVEAAP